jgi:hypothetical protein
VAFWAVPFHGGVAEPPVRHTPRSRKVVQASARRALDVLRDQFIAIRQFFDGAYQVFTEHDGRR